MIDTRILPDVMFIECKDWDELERAALKATKEDNYYGIGSGAGLLLIKSKPIVLSAFAALIDKYIEHTKQDMVPVTVVCSTKTGIEAVGVGINTAEAIYLYGMPGPEWMEYVKTIQRDKSTHVIN